MGLFDFGDDIDFNKASDYYKKYSELAQKLQEQRYSEGRGDISRGYDEAIGYQKPYMEAGTSALSALMDSLGLGKAGGEQAVYNKFTESPAYKYALESGMKAVQRQGAATGRTASGAEQMALQQVGSGLASQNWDKYFENYQNRLSNIAGAGQGAATTAGGFSSNRGSGLAQLGYGYTGMQSNTLEALGKNLAEANMSEQMAKAQSSSNWMSGLGSLIGGVGGLMTGNPFAMMGGASGLASLFGGSRGGGGGRGGMPSWLQSEFNNPINWRT